MLKNAYFLAKIGAGTAENERNLHWLPPLAAAVAIYAAQQRDIPMKELLFPVR